MRKLPREAQPGSKWAYKTGETHLIGALLRKATGKQLSDYLSEKIWKPYGMERDAVWQTLKTGGEFSGCCMAIALRDYARIGQLVLDGGKANGKQIIDAKYLTEATSKQADIGIPGRGYGYQWWTLDDGAFHATGIFGQSLFIDPKRQLVIATSGNWPTATDREVLQPARFAFWREVQAAVDRQSR
jgi:CubicO group peptidase (beta-lactamase class C family)